MIVIQIHKYLRMFINIIVNIRLFVEGAKHSKILVCFKEIFTSIHITHEYANVNIEYTLDLSSYHLELLFRLICNITSINILKFRIRNLFNI